MPFLIVSDRSTPQLVICPKLFVENSKDAELKKPGLLNTPEFNNVGLKLNDAGVTLPLKLASKRGH